MYGNIIETDDSDLHETLNKEDEPNMTLSDGEIRDYFQDKEEEPNMTLSDGEMMDYFEDNVVEIADDELLSYFDSPNYYPEPPRIHRVSEAYQIGNIRCKPLDRMSWDKFMLRKYGWNSNSTSKRFFTKL